METEGQYIERKFQNYCKLMLLAVSLTLSLAVGGQKLQMFYL